MDSTMIFENFDPLTVVDHHNVDESVQIRRLKRNIHSILHSYVGWYDPFAELIQNALDSIDKKYSQQDSFRGKISIRIDLQDSSVTVSDNGIGLDRSTFEKFLAPPMSLLKTSMRAGVKV